MQSVFQVRNLILQPSTYKKKEKYTDTYIINKDGYTVQHIIIIIIIIY